VNSALVRRWIIPSSSSFSRCQESIVRKGEPDALGEFHEIFPAFSGVVPGLPHHGLDLLVVHVAGKAAHAVTFDKATMSSLRVARSSGRLGMA